MTAMTATNSRSAVASLALVAVITCDAVRPAHAHGGLPISQQILRRDQGERMHVPVFFWGLWVGDGVGPWTWICEEEINLYRARKFGLSKTGTLYATNTKSVTISNDDGCTWTNYAEAPLANLGTSDIAVDPMDGSTAYVTTADFGDGSSDGGISDNGLFVTHDRGTTFTRVAQLTSGGRLFHSVLVAPSRSQRIYVTSSLPSPAPSAPALHRSDDFGDSFTLTPLTYQLDTRTPSQVVLLGVDPRVPDRLYARAQVAYVDETGAKSRQALLHSSDGGATFVERWKMDGVSGSGGFTRGIDGVAFDVARGKVWIATAAGMLSIADDGTNAPGTATPIGNLSRAQCVDVHGDDVFACTNNYAPELAAIARSSDGATTFSSVFTYDKTEGPVACPASTPVGANCPFYWLTYGSQLGVEFPDGGVGADLGAAIPKDGCDCDLVGRAARKDSWIVVMLALAFAIRAIRRSCRCDRSWPSDDAPLAHRRG